MWSDADLDALDAKHNELSTALEQYRDLLGHYRRLKSDYEEEKEAREKYKRLARGQERNPFVLVLVDGDGYIVSNCKYLWHAFSRVRALTNLHRTISDLTSSSMSCLSWVMTAA
jgi:hypothetical protein